MIAWQRMPDTFGWWFYTPELENWDLARPVSVDRIENAVGDERFETEVNAQRRVIDDDMGWWYGPVVVARPEAA